MSDTGITSPLSPTEVKARNHALLCSIGFLILLPLGSLIPRYTRTLPYKWFYVHFPIQLILAGPVIFAGWRLGHETTNLLESPHFIDTHQRIGLALLILYVVQLVLGIFVHFVKLPSLFRGHRPPQSYFHVIVGLAIIILAQYQVHYGLYIEWDSTIGIVHPIPNSAKHAWLALVVVFWALYILGMALIPRQFKQEKQIRDEARKDEKSET